MNEQQHTAATSRNFPGALGEALRRLDDEPVNSTLKGMPQTSLKLGEIGDQGWSVLRGDVPLPAMVLRGEALEHNIALMQSYCDRHGAWLAPHGKTPMAPQLWAKQLQAGAWAISVANASQLQVARAFGIKRALVANQVVGEYDIRYLGEQLRDAPEVELYVLVDSLAGVERLEAGLRKVEPGRPLPVLLEFGPEGGRCGVRDLAALGQLAGAVLEAEPVLNLAGVEGYEGLFLKPEGVVDIEAVDGFLASLAEAVRMVRARVPEREPFIASAGGSMYFDRVVEFLGREALPEAQLVLRSGAYVAHDSDWFEVNSPMGASSLHPVAGERLRPALEIWSEVLSLPEPGVAILGMGKRDFSFDVKLPVPQFLVRGEGQPEMLGEGYEVFNTSDQHAFLRVPPGAEVSVGDRIGCGISHPCTAFDKWRLLFVVDDERNITGAVRTFF
jgi:D-serine dehydratase